MDEKKSQDFIFFDEKIQFQISEQVDRCFGNDERHESTTSARYDG